MRFESPTTTKAAAALLASESGVAHVLAGGTDLLVRMKMGATEPDLVVDIKRIDSLRELKVTAAGVHIGAAVPAIMLGESEFARALARCCGSRKFDRVRSDPRALHRRWEFV